MTQKVCVAVGQFTPLMSQPEKNADLAAELAAGASEMGAKFILFPEMCITGADKESLDLRPTAIPPDHPAVRRLQDAAREHGIAICAGFIEKAARGCYNTQAVALPDGTLASQHKAVAPKVKGWLVERRRTIINVGALRVGLIICADSAQRGLYEEVMRRGANIICHPSAGYEWETSGKDEVDEAKLREVADHWAACLRRAQKRACELGVAYLVSNPVGRGHGVLWPGNGGIIDRDGSVRAWLPGEACAERMRPAFVVADVTAGD